jgi:hypothetical protein
MLFENADQTSRPSRAKRGPGLCSRMGPISDSVDDVFPDTPSAPLRLLRTVRLKPMISAALSACYGVLQLGVVACPSASLADPRTSEHRSPLGGRLAFRQGMRCLNSLSKKPAVRHWPSPKSIPHRHPYPSRKIGPVYTSASAVLRRSEKRPDSTTRNSPAPKAAL